MSHRLARLAAVLAPALVLLAAWWLSGQLEERELSQAARAMDRDLEEQRPKLVVLGNSSAGLGLDSEQLAEELGMPVLELTVPNSRAPVWYAVLKNRVAAAPEPPAAVLVAGQIPHLLSVEPGRGLDRVRLAEHMSPHEPVLARKVLGTDAEGTTSAGIEAWRFQLRQLLLEEFRNTLIGGLYAPFGKGSLRVRGQIISERAFDKVLGQEALGDLAELEELGAVDPAHLMADPADSLVADLLDIVDVLGARLIFLRIPVDPTFAGFDAVEPRTQAALVDLLQRRDAAFLEPAVPPGPTDYRDPVHLTPAAAHRLTAQVARDLVALGALSGGPLAVGSGPLQAPEVTRTGTPPGPWPLEGPFGEARCGQLLPADAPLWGAPGGPPSFLVGPSTPLVVTEGGALLQVAAEGECVPGVFEMSDRGVHFNRSGDEGPLALALSEEPTLPNRRLGRVAWVYPGTELRLDFPEGWPEERGTFAVQVALQPLGEGGEAPTYRVGDGPWTGFASFGGRMVGSGEHEPPSGPWSLEIRSPEGGPFGVLASVAVGLGEQQREALGLGGDPKRVVALALGRVPSREKFRYTRPPPPLEDAVVRWQQRPDVGIVHLPHLEHLSDEAVGKCSPYVVFENGRPLPFPRRRCRVVNDKPGAQCHAQKQIRFRATDREVAGSWYALGVVRGCGRRHWLLRNDSLIATVEGESLQQFFRGADEVHLVATGFNERGRARAPVLVSVRADGRLVTEGVLSVTSAEDPPVTLQLPERIAPDVQQVEIQLTNMSRAQILVERMLLMEWYDDGEGRTQ